MAIHEIPWLSDMRRLFGADPNEVLVSLHDT